MTDSPRHALERIRDNPPKVDDRATIFFVVMFMFGMVVMLLLAFAAAMAKGNPLIDVFTAVGAIGQVVFAFMVWRLGHQQFQFMKRVARRQTRIDTFEHRLSLFNRYTEARKLLYLRNLSDGNLMELFHLGREVERLFSQPTVALFERLEEAADELLSKQEEIEEAKRVGDEAKVHTLIQERSTISRVVRPLTREVFKAMNDELRIDPEA